LPFVNDNHYHYHCLPFKVSSVHHHPPIRDISSDALADTGHLIPGQDGDHTTATKG